MQRCVPIVLVALGSTAVAAPGDDLRALGLRVRAELARGLLPISGDLDHREIPAIGACTRPTAAQRASLEARVRANGGIAAFGCVEPTGIVLDVTDDVRDKTGHRTGVWSVVRASAPAADATLTTLRHYEGTSSQDFMEWANEVTVSTQALVDIDGDGTLDAVIVRDQHEGGARRHDLTVRLWRSSTGKSVELGAYDDVVYLVSPAPGGMFVVAGQRRTPDDKASFHYACLAPTGKLSLCPDVAAARRRLRKAEIAGWFIDGHTYELGDARPDRERLAALLDELEIPAAAQAPLLAAAPPTTPTHRVAREVARVVTPRLSTRYDEVVDAPPPADRRPARLAALLDDAPCTDAPASAARELAAWIAAHDPAAIAASGACKPGAPCAFTRPDKPTIAACGNGPASLMFATWSYVDPEAGVGVVRSAVFRRGPSLAPVVSALLCTACGDVFKGEALNATLYRHAGHSIAIIQGSGATRAMSVVVDGAPGAAPPAGAKPAWLGEPDATLGDVVATGTPQGTTYWHFDGASWSAIVTVPFDDVAALPATASPAARFVFEDAQRTFARGRLQRFEPGKWAADPAARAALRRDLVRIDADPATLARVDAEAAKLP